MTSPLMDQALAARAEARELMFRVFPKARNTPIPQPPEWAEAFLDRLLADGAQFCPHARTPRPVFASVWERHWRCRSCMTKWSQEQRDLQERGERPTLGWIEEFTCDFCRTYVGDTLDPTVIRLDLWTVIGGACPRCFDLMASQPGATVESK